MKKNWENPELNNLSVEETKQPGDYYKCVNCGRFHLVKDVNAVDFDEKYCPCGHGYYMTWTGADPVVSNS